MKRYGGWSLTRVVLPGFCFFLVAFLLFASAVAGSTIFDEDITRGVGNLEIEQGFTVNGDVALSLGDLEVAGVVNGNVSNDLGQVAITGDVNGNVTTNIGKVIVSGIVSGDVQSRMGEINIEGTVGGDVRNDLGSIAIIGVVGGDVYSGLGDLVIEGIVAGNVDSKSGRILVAGMVEGDVYLEQGVVELEADAVVSGTIYVGKGRVKKADGALAGSITIGDEVNGTGPDEGMVDADRVQGERFHGVDSDLVQSIVEEVRSAVEEALRSTRIFPFRGRIGEWIIFPTALLGFYGNLIRNLVNILVIYAFAALTMALFPRQVKVTGEALAQKTGLVIGWGILAIVLAVPLMVLLTITIIGIPLILLEIVIIALAGLLGYTGLSTLLGERVIRAASARPVNQYGSLALGVLIIGLAGMVPLFGPIVSLAAFVLALGAAIVSRFGSMPARPSP